LVSLRIKKTISAQTKETKEQNTEFNMASEEFKAASRNYKSIMTELKRQSGQKEKKESEYGQLSDRLGREKRETNENYEVEKSEKQAKIEAIKKEVGKVVEQERFKIKDNAMYSNAIEHAQGLLSN